ncbi:ABC transporter ATP-binding protein [Ensifer sp. SSB1]|jgi:branched-chain amino acid transport system ATP-binding protein|uniref:ABC transporter ATP-binding protein n=1 Tax=Ensifer sp. SSB1 TaxID=2795385 RepID=UPI001A52C232|nr:ABC transporter ATP-binding protein [Ensifer sp. SSB1]MBK5567091.1 ABC transporter ATP-binding protein [Ensifer sp. SSB1]
MNCLEVKKLRSGYGSRNVLFDVSLSVGAGKVVGIVGPNGHGKTTLLKTISGLITASDGDIRFKGSSIRGRSPHDIARLGVSHVPQGDLLFPQMTVWENLMMGAFRESDPTTTKRRLDLAVRLFPKLTQLEKKVVRSLSGGERRMVGIGRGLMAAADLIMIDEPSLGLAPLVIDQVYAAINEIRAAGVSVLLVEENPERAASMADYLYLVDNGSVKWQGDQEAFKSAGRELIQTYLGS